MPVVALGSETLNLIKLVSVFFQHVNTFFHKERQLSFMVSFCTLNFALVKL
jgi:hypothetical protein